MCMYDSNLCDCIQYVHVLLILCTYMWSELPTWAKFPYVFMHCMHACTYLVCVKLTCMQTCTHVFLCMYIHDHTHGPFSAWDTAGVHCV